MLCDVMRRYDAETSLIGLSLVGPTPGSHPSPDTRPPGNKSLELRQQPTPTAWPARGSFCDGQSVFSSQADFTGMCVAAATLLEYFASGQKTLEQTGTHSTMSRNSHVIAPAARGLRRADPFHGRRRRPRTPTE